MARPPQDPQVRITEILNAAEPLFYSKGYHETAISDIAQKMGVAYGVVYYYFKSKEELLEALINRELSDFISKIKALGYLVKLDTNGTNPEMLRFLYENHR